jgi:hypothetical protein
MNPAAAELAKRAATWLRKQSAQVAVLQEITKVHSMLTLTLSAVRRILKMRPEHEARRTIIREWMSLPQERRQTEEQAAAFATQAAEKHKFTCSGNRNQRITAWLLPRTAKA